MVQTKTALLFLLCLLVSTITYAQENCSNGIDDDNDDLVDQFDPDCPCDPNEESFYGYCAPACEYTPPPGSNGSNFDFTTQWTSTQGVENYSSIVVADMDGEADDVSEIVVLSYIGYHSSNTNSIKILDGNTGALKYHPNTLRIHSRNKGMAVADADGDGRAEFFYITSADEDFGDTLKLVCYEYNPSGSNPAGYGTGTFSLKWKSSHHVSCGLTGGDVFAVEDFAVNLADFNYDGTPEIYIGNEIYNATNGQRITTGGSNSIGSWNHGIFASAYHVVALPVAVDVLPDAACADCAGLELVAGNQVYSVNISTGTMTVVKTAAGGLTDGNTAIVDYDLDGDLDAVVTTTDGFGSYVYIWDLQTTSQIGNTHTVQTTTTLGFYHPVNLPIIADFDGDNRPEIGICGNLIFQVVEDHTVNIGGTGGVLWSIATTDNSGQTGAAVFDFNGDGVAEVIYRDEHNLRMMSGPNGGNLATISCGSGTGGEYPIIADIDNDGETEIVCNCDNNPGSSMAVGYTTAFKSDQFPWVPTRKLWNQYSYFNVNINDDLTIPRQQQQHHLVGSPTVGTSGILNTFLKQTSPLDDTGDPVYPAPDVEVTVSNVDLSQCLTSDQITVTVAIQNSGDLAVAAGMPVSFYPTDPTATNATLLGIAHTTSGIPANGSLNQSFTFNVSSLTLPFTLYAVGNDDGSTTRPYNLTTDFPVTATGECDFTNNINSTLVQSCCTGVLSMSTPSVGSCIDHPYADVATLSVTISWTGQAPNEDILVSIDGKTEYIDIPGGATSPQTVTFQIPADGSTGNSITANFETVDCPTSKTYNAPNACSNDELTCSILYLCGDDKDADADAFDHGLIDYLEGISTSFIKGAFTKNNGSGLGLYDPNNTSVAVDYDIDTFNIIIVSGSTWGRVSSNLKLALKHTHANVLVLSQDVLIDLAMASGKGYSYQTHAYSDNTTQVELYNFNPPNPHYSPIVGRGNYHATASAYLWKDAFNQSSDIQGVFFNYEIADVLGGVPQHGNRVFLGYMMEGVYRTAATGGGIPVPQSGWFDPIKHLTQNGKLYLDQALELVQQGCGVEDCDDEIDNDADGLVDCADPDCIPANAPGSISNN